MKARQILMLLVLILGAGALHAEIIYVLNSQSRTLSRIDTDTDSVQNTFSILGNSPNKVIIGEPDLFVVNSGDNSVARIDAQSGARLATYLVEAGSNPWDLLLHEGFLYITGLFSSKVYKMNAQNGQIVAQVTVGTAPEALCVSGGKLYISNAGNYQQNYSGSSVSVIDLAGFSVLKTIPTPANPQYIVVEGDRLHVSCTGNWTDIGGAVVVIDTISDEIVQKIDLGGTPGNIYIDAEATAWVADSSGYALYGYDAEDYNIIYDAQNPMSNGGSDITGNSVMTVILAPNWGSNGNLRVLRPDFSPWKSYTVGMMPTDLKLHTEASSNDDLLLSPPAFSLYPNPAKQGAALYLEAKAAISGTVELFNIRGQKVMSSSMQQGKAELNTQTLVAGCYFYRIGIDRGFSTGKFVLLK